MKCSRTEYSLADPQDLVTVREVPARQCPYARQKLPHVERFDQVVVGPCLQPFDAIFNGVLGREHEDRRGETALAQGAADLESACAREDHVEHHHIERGGCSGGQGFASVARQVDDDRPPPTAVSFPLHGLSP
jgi:hypothetical protein